MKPLRVQWYVVIALVLAPIYVFAFAAQHERAGLPGALITATQGVETYRLTLGKDRFSVTSRQEAELLASGYSHDPPTPAGADTEAGRTLGSSRLVLVQRHDAHHLVITFLNGLLFWLVGLFVFAPRAGDRAARSFFWTSMLFGLVVMIDDITFPAHSPWRARVLGTAWVVALAVLPLLFLRLCLVFPRRSPLLDRWPWFLPALWSVSLGLAVWRVVGYLNYFASPDPSRVAGFEVPSRFAAGLLIAEATAAIAVLYHSGRKLEAPKERQQTRWLLIGIAVGVTPYVFLRALPRQFGWESPVDPWVDRLFEIAIPISFCLAVIRYQFLEIDIIIRRSLIYGTLAACAVAVAALLAFAVEGPLRGWWGYSLVLVGIGILSGVVFFPLRERIGAWVDRTFFKIRHDYDRLIDRLNQRLETAICQEDVVGHLDAFIRSALRPKTHAVVVRFEDQERIGGRLEPTAVRRILPGVNVATRGRSGPFAAPGTTSRPELEATGFPGRLVADGVVLVQPIRIRAIRAGVLLLGPKRTERHYVEPDLELLARAADSAAFVLERLQLVQRAAEEGSARRRSEEMNRLKSDFLSHIAHDLRSPLASISWSVDNLLDGVVDDVPPQVADYLASIKASAGHLNRLVANLLEISRLERGTAELALEPLALEAIVQETVASLTPLAREKDVELRFKALGVVRVRGNLEKLQEVVVNLVDNAINFTPAGTDVIVTVDRRDDGKVRVTVRDHGPGVPDEERQVIFERFRQGSSAPDTPRHGFGLGLHIVREYLRRMGGRVSVGNHPEGGAVFTFILDAMEEAERSES